MVVLGAGGGRLAYDLHRLCGATETIVLDIDPYLLVIAEAVVRGATLRLTESSLNVFEATRTTLAWTLNRSAGPLADDRFYFLLANGLEPPLSDGVWDTIVTPWFIRPRAPHLEEFLAVLVRLLRPGGAGSTRSLARCAGVAARAALAREEIFDLASGAGFRIDRWSAEARLLLVSPLTAGARWSRS